MNPLSRSTPRGGFTLLEVMIASLVGAIVAGGTMMAYIVAARLMRAQDNPQVAEATWFAQETMERFRNMIACGQGSVGEWFDQASCAPVASPPAPLGSGMPTAWTSDPLPAGAGTRSIVASGVARRCYRMTPADCDGDGTAGDCFQMDVQICWKTIDPTCNCP